MPGTVKIELKLPSWLFEATAASEDGPGNPSIVDLIIDAAAQRVLKGADSDSLMRRSLRAKIEDLRDEEIRARIVPSIDEAMTLPIQRTDEWGNPRGGPTTINEQIVKMATEYLTKNTGIYSTPETIVQKFIKQEVERVFASEMKKAMDEAKAEVIAAVKEKGAEVLAQTIAKMAGAS